MLYPSITNLVTTRLTSRTTYTYIICILIAVVAAVTCPSCARQDEPVRSDAIFLADGVEVYRDSIVIDGHTHTALSRYEITNAWHGTSDTVGHGSLPVLYADARMAEAVYTKSLSEYANSPLTPLDICLTGALLDPARSMETLRSMVSDGAIHRHGYPLTADKEAWAAAAWEVYCATGSAEWLKEAYKVIYTTYMREVRTLRAGDGLIHGTPSYMTPVRDYFPAWMAPVDRFQVIASGTNVWHYATLSVLARMAAELKLYAGREWETEAAKVRSAINDAFWVPSRSLYGQYLYGDLYPILSPSADNRAGALCIILGIATPEMAQRMMSSCVTLPEGVPAIYPPMSGTQPEFSPETQALHGIAAARTGNEDALLGATAALWRLALDDRGHAQWPALALHGLFGLALREDGLAVNPVIPSRLGSHRRLEGLTYRDALLDINISGSGDKIASFSLDSVRNDSHIIPPDLHGHHTVDIVMSGNRLSENTAPVTPTVEDPSQMPPMPRVYWENPSHGKILNYDPAATYEVYVNGILSENLSSENYEVSDTGTAVIDIVPVAEGQSGFAPRSHVTAPPSAVIHIPATAITPRRPPLNLIRNPEIASRYIELAARHNTR
ncbi:MAG: hypothetical protein K2K77_08785, partial [Duncaniella sp.]|nr:hypothetical protein [Duncaniella sp.]